MIVWLTGQIETRRLPPPAAYLESLEHPPQLSGLVETLHHLRSLRTDALVSLRLLSIRNTTVT